MGAQGVFQATVRDDGALRYMQIRGLPIVESAEAIELPAFDWRALLKQAIMKLYVANAIHEEFGRRTGYAMPDTV